MTACFHSATRRRHVSKTVLYPWPVPSMMTTPRRNLLAAFDAVSIVDRDDDDRESPVTSLKRSLLTAFDTVADTPVPSTANVPKPPPPAAKRRRKPALLKVSKRKHVL